MRPRVASALAPARRPRRPPRRPASRAIALTIAGGAVLGLLPPGRSAAATRPAPAARLELRTGAAYQSRSWEAARGDFTATEYLLPVDVSWRSPGLRLSAGADFTRGAADLPGEGNVRLSLGEFRSAAEVGIWNDRMRVAAGTRIPTNTAGLGPGPAEVAELFDEVALGFGRARHPGGPSLVLGIGGQPVVGPELAVQFGAAWERRGAYELLDDGRKLDPGDLWRSGLSVTAGRGSVLGELAARWDRIDESSYAGGFRYREGDLFAARAGLRRQFDRGRLDLTASLATRADGSVDAGSPLVLSAVGGGRSGRVGVSGVRRTVRGDAGVALGLLNIRGYPGDLGHAWALEPGLSWASGLATGRLGLAVRGLFGRCRSDRALRGWDLSLTWQREWRP